MTAHVELTNRAFAVLESMPEPIAFDIFARLDRLSQFPEMGSPLGPRFPKLGGFRQLVYKRRIRMVYEFDRTDRTVYVLAIQDARRKMPTARDLKRDLDPDQG